eukprot:2973-Heterococcus_DN1.PRE.2
MELYLEGEKGLRSTVLAAPSSSSSVIATPVTGAHRIPCDSAFTRVQHLLKRADTRLLLMLSFNNRSSTVALVP